MKNTDSLERQLVRLQTQYEKMYSKAKKTGTGNDYRDAQNMERSVSYMKSAVHYANLSLNSN